MISFLPLSAALFQVTHLINAGIMALQISRYPREKGPRGIGTAGNLACLSTRFHHRHPASPLRGEAGTDE